MLKPQINPCPCPAALRFLTGAGKDLPPVVTGEMEPLAMDDMGEMNPFEDLETDATMGGSDFEFGQPFMTSLKGLNDKFLVIPMHVYKNAADAAEGGGDLSSDDEAVLGESPGLVSTRGEGESERGVDSATNTVDAVNDYTVGSCG